MGWASIPLRCKSFAWFMHRFKHVYEAGAIAFSVNVPKDGGLIPKETFTIRAVESGGRSHDVLPAVRSVPHLRGLCRVGVLKWMSCSAEDQWQWPGDCRAVPNQLGELGMRC